MSSEVIIAIVAAVGASGIGGSLIMWIQNRRRNSVEVTEILNRLSKDALLDAEGTLKELKTDVRELTQVLTELVRVIEIDVLPLIPAHHVQTRAQIRVSLDKAREIIL